MTLELDLVISRVFDAIRTEQSPALVDLFQESAVVTDDHRRFEGLDELDLWRRLRLLSKDERLYTIDTKRVANATIVETLTCQSSGTSSLLSKMQWQFELKDSKVVSLAVATGGVYPLAVPVASFIEGINLQDLDMLTGSFTDDARVNDQLSEYVGIDAIREWAKQDVIGADLRVKVLKGDTHYGCTILTADVDGNFDKRGLPDPLIHKFYFTLADDKIVLLIILRDEN